MRHAILLLLLAASTTADAVVIRHDVDDARYRMEAEAFPALVDLTHEGHGVLIAPQWIVTAAHATQWHPVEEIMLNGTCRTVERVVVHPGYQPLPKELQAGDAAPALAFLAGSDDIALVKLAEPVTDVAPVVLYRAGDERGRLVTIVGKGGTGNGLGGQAGPHRTELRQAGNVVTGVDERWLDYVFHSGDQALALEGMSGNGDSGGPVLIEVAGEWRVAGITSWVDHAHGQLADLRPGVYGQTSKNVRISRYAAWIDAVLASDADGNGGGNTAAAMSGR